MVAAYNNLEHDISVSKNSQEANERLKLAASGLVYLKKNLGELNLHYADALQAIARAYVLQEKLVEANYYFGLCSDLFLDLELEVTPNFSKILNSWAFVCTTLGNRERSHALFVQAVRANRSLYGEESIHYLRPLENYGHEFLLGEAYEKALFVFEKVAALRFSLSGPNDPEYRQTMVTIAQTQWLLNRQDNKEAQELFEQAIGMSSRIFGRSHIDYASCLTDLASLLMQNSSDPRIASLLLEAVKIDRAHLDRSAQGQTEQQHFRMSNESRGSYFKYLTYAASSGACDRSAYEQVLNWKGASFKERWSANSSRHASPGTSLRSSYDRSARILSNFATVVDQVSAKMPNDGLITSAIQTKEDLWRAMLITGQPKERATFANIEAIQAAITAKGALVDFVEYNHFANGLGGDPTKPITEPRFMAAVLRKEGPVKLIPLVAAQPIERAIAKWRRELQGGAGALRDEPSEESAPAILRRMLWEPLEGPLTGIESVVLCPDGFLSFMPWSALPSKDASRYLIEDYAISTVPVAQFVARRKPEQRSANPVSMLLLGNPSYKKVLNRSAIEQLSTGLQFSQLPGTAKEVAEIASLYSKQADFDAPNLAQGTKASEEFVRSTASKVRYVHLATHGFFRPDAWQADKPERQQAEARDQLHRFVPEAMAGIALAGANNSLAADWNAAAKDIPDDGILTALEVTTMDFSNVDLVVLSACETSLGAFEIGEGSLGLQQSFQIAGARATISSLWKVDDSATQVLMVEFYRNLWEKKLPQGEALRQAQLTMLNQYDPAKQALQPRGLKLVNPKQPDSSSKGLQPFYWAAFFLSGDYR